MINVSLDSTNEVLEEHHYYPFGLKLDGPWLQRRNQGLVDRYNYNGKEEMPFTGYLYYGFRVYDPAMARFTSIDPISDQFPHVSTFNYAENSPIANIDLHGLQKIGFDVRLDQSVKELTSGKITQQEYLDRLKAEGQGGMLAAAIMSPIDEFTAGLYALGRLITAGRAVGLGRGLSVGSKVLKGLGISKDAIKVTDGASDQVTIIGEGMKRVTGLADELKDSGKSINVFEPSKAAAKQWDELTSGGKHLSDEAVQGTKMYQENKAWIEQAKESGSTIIDIGSDGRKNASTFYKMEKEVFDAGSQRRK